MVDAGVEEITQIISLDKNKLIKFETLKAEFNLKCTDKMYQKLKKTICETNKRIIKPYILKRLKINTKWEFNKKTAYFDKETDAYEIYVDETLKNNKAAYAVFSLKNSPNNHHSRVEGEQTL